MKISHDIVYYGNPNVTKFKLKCANLYRCRININSRVQKYKLCIWKEGEKGQSCKLKAVKVQSCIWKGATCKFKGAKYRAAYGRVQKVKPVNSRMQTYRGHGSHKHSI